ncbi:MAG: SLAC1 anion channel family protein [Sulfuricurvum sp.]
MLTHERIRHFPITLFAMVMGVSGLTIAYERAFHLLHVPRLFFLILLAVSTLLFLNHLIVYTVKIIRFPDAVAGEFFHPVRMNFFPSVSISLLLLSIAYYSFFPVVGIILWFIGTAIHTILTLYIFAYWIRNNFEITHSNPAWFIPIVGNVIVPIVGVDVLGAEAMLFYFSIGIFFWFIFLTVMLYRIIFHHQLAEKFLPTLFILIAPPAVGFIAYVRITMNYDMFALFLISIGYFFTVLLLLMGRGFSKLRFFVSWWAFTFPLDAITLASLLAYQITGHLFYHITAIVLLFITTTVIAAVGYKTLYHTAKQEICIQE